MSRKKVIPFVIFGLIGITAVLYLTMLFDSLLTKSSLESYNLFCTINYVVSRSRALRLFLLLVAAIVLGVMMMFLTSFNGYKSDLMEITPDILIPVPAGQGQCGTARWLNRKDFDRVFRYYTLDRRADFYKLIAQVSLLDIKKELIRIQKIEEEIDQLKLQLKECKWESQVDLLMKLEEKEAELKEPALICRNPEEADRFQELFQRIQSGEFDQYLLPDGGLVYGKEDSASTEKIYYNGEDTHALVLGATRSGKDRCVCIQTICTLALAGESMIITDPKPELLYYVRKLLELFGYQIITQDYRYPAKSSRYNYLQLIIDYIKQEDLPSAIDATWDLTSQLVGEPKGERLWNDGEASIIAASIMAVVYDNRAPENQRYCNLTNVFYFISQMCTPIALGNVSVVPLNYYMRDLPCDHPSKGLLSVGEIAPSKTRGSFYTSALMTLKLFTNPLIADMTSTSDYDACKIGSKKTAVFIVLPDDRKTYSNLASLYVTMQYQMLSKAADLRGGRLERRVNFLFDEMGNFAKISNLTSMQTVGGGKGIRFHFFVQDYIQLEDVYDDKQATIIRSNCENWIYLQTDDLKTLKDLSDKLGKYTINTYSLGASHQKFSNPSSSHNISLAGRELLTPDEVKRIKRPYSLVTSRNAPAIHTAPDLSQWYFNTILGLGSKEHNRRVRLARENLREARKVTGKMELWGIWNEYIDAIKREQEEKQREAEQRMMEKLMNANSYS